ncbi:MAG: hypothetical protein MUO54_09630 [Anaerolineales bacterium]|nr:hypothetical protein [Anaerolineales bacterium]
MQTALLIFLIIFAVAIGFFLGMFLLSLNTPLTKRFTKKETEVESDLPAGELDASKTASGPPAQVEQIRKPSPDSRLLLQIWKEEGKPPVYDLDGTYLDKEDLPREILNIITVHTETTPAPVSPSLPLKEVPVPIVAGEDEGDAEIKMLSVVDEVNEILQKKIAGSAIAGKGIHLMENHNNEIRFWVGLNSYDDVEEIPDPEVRQVIDAAVKEWERTK